MSSISRPGLGARGDTIVEVMIVLAVLGLTLSISYATANHSLLAARQAQENSEASELLQSQVELLRYIAPGSTPDSGVFTLPTPPPGASFCIKPGIATPTPTPPTPVLSTDPSYAATCTDQGQEKLYNITIQNISTPTALDTFLFEVKWDDVQGQGIDTVTITARIHPAIGAI
jgi:prepilin-type N-terminal cleavage/methylation domain-containing protein